MNSRSVAWIPALFLAAACGEAGGDAQWAGTVEDSAGVQMVHNSLEPMVTEGEVFTFEEVLVFGEAAGDPDYQFGQIAGLDAASDGRILVLDQQAGHVKVFSADGVFESTISQSGAGPGELGPQAALLMVGRGDTILVPDMGNQRVNLFFLDGSVPSSFPIRMEEGIPWRWEMSDQGLLVAQRRALNIPGQSTQSDTDLIARQGYDGGVADTLLTPPRGETMTFGAGGIPEFHFFVPEPMWTLLNDGSLVFAMNDQFSIDVYDLDGNLARVITMPVEKQPVSEEDVSIITDMIEVVFEQQGVPPQGIDIMMQGMTFEDVYPAFTQMRSGPGNGLWVQRIGIPSQMTEEQRENFNPMLDQGSPEWDVFDAEGRLEGMITMPERFTPFSLKGDLLYGVWRDEFEVQYVKVYRVTRTPTA